MYALPTICFAFLVSIFFSKSSFALNVSMVVFFLLYLIYPPIQNYGESIHSTLKMTAVSKCVATRKFSYFSKIVLEFLVPEK